MDTYLSESGRIIARVSAANDRFRATATCEGSVSAAFVQYYLSRIAFLEHVHVYFDYLDDATLPPSCREDFEAYTAFLDAQTLFSRLRYLWVSENNVFPTDEYRVSQWKQRVESSWITYQRTNLNALKKAGRSGAEWVEMLREIGDQAALETPHYPAVLSDANAAAHLWESAFVWSLATSEEIDGTDKAAGDLFPNAVAALAAVGSIHLYEAGGGEEARRSRDADLIYAAISEESLQAFHRAIFEKNLTPVSFAVGVVAKSAIARARSAYLRYAGESSREGIEHSLVDSLRRQIGDRLAQSAGPLLLEPPTA